MLSRVNLHTKSATTDLMSLRIAASCLLHYQKANSTCALWQRTV